MSAEPFHLSVVIPAHNAAADLPGLLASLAAVAVAAEVVIVDDGSDPPLSEVVETGMLPAGTGVIWLRNEPDETGAGRGAGAARNQGQAAAIGTHVLFLDADDLVLPALGPVVRALHGQTFDVALFAHTDSRRLRRGAQGPDESLDRALWADVAPGPLPRPMQPAEAAILCRISNYPWNKIWRRSFLIEAGVRCTEIPLHNDIEPHWAAFLSTDRLLVSGEPCVLHNVAEGRAQLTNRRSAARLQLFEALDAVLARFAREAERRPDSAAFIGPFVDFVLRLCGWVATTMEDGAEQHTLLRNRRRFLAALGDLPAPVRTAFEQAVLREPALALRVFAALDPA